MTANLTLSEHRWNSQHLVTFCKILFIIFVNAMFTTFVDPRFTKAFE